LLFSLATSCKGSSSAATDAGTASATTSASATAPSTAAPASAAATPAVVPNADRVVATLRPRFKQCYQQGLTKNPWLEGRTVIVAKVAANGTVASATPSETTGLPDDVIQCIVRAVQSATFDPPTGTGATLAIPVTYTQPPDAGPRR
jgi:hypothetical protein